MTVDFLIDRIIVQATKEGLRLSDVERRLLSWLDKQPYSAADDELHTAFVAETSYEAFGSKIGGLVRRAFEHDKALSETATDQYRRAYQEIASSDYYLRYVLGEEMEALVEPSASRNGVHSLIAKAGLTLFLLVPAAITALFGGGVVWMALQREFEGFTLLPAALGTAALFIASVFLVRLWRREMRSMTSGTSGR